MDTASFFGKILPLAVWRFSRKPMWLELSIPICRFTFATGTYLTGVLKYLRPGTDYGTQRGWEKIPEAEKQTGNKEEANRQLTLTDAFMELPSDEPTPFDAE